MARAPAALGWRAALGILGPIARHPWAGREAVVEFQARRLRRIVDHARGQVPYYRWLLGQAGLRPGDVRTAADLVRVPITARPELQSQPLARRLAAGVDPERLIARTTSGSSGEPLTIRRTWIEERVLNLFRLRALHALGLRPTDRLALLGVARALQRRDHQGPQRLAQALGLYGRREISCLQPLGDVLAAVRAFDPHVLGGYPAVLEWLAGGAEAPLPSLHLVVSGGEVLAPAVRTRIAGGLGVPVFETYGSHEFNLLAWECRQTGLLHVCDDSVVVEILCDGRPAAEGEPGEVVATALHSFAMPFLRYRLGDVATRGPTPCPCGRPFSTIAAVQGRALDYLELPGDRRVHPYQIVRAFVHEPGGWVRRYRIVQDRIDHLTLRIAPLQEPTAETLARLREEIQAVVGPDVRLDVDLVSDLALEPSGKLRVVQSSVPPRRRAPAGGADPAGR